jgi:hypothetical protein
MATKTATPKIKMSREMLHTKVVVVVAHPMQKLRGDGSSKMKQSSLRLHIRPGETCRKEASSMMTSKLSCAERI